ncbi:VCBS repeat-containing protein [Algoriphagus zhangzhouensis]|nr:VCBS repeat-containing protein [Algoriphagus zhangzhouensis]
MKRNKPFLFSLSLIAFVSLFGCNQKQSEPTLFELISPEKSGIQFENTLVSSAEINILEYLYFYNGGGVAAGDINNDGLVDLYFSGNQVADKLYLNQGNFQFKDITETAGIPNDGSWSNGVTMADVNGDGLLDIYVSQLGGYKDFKGKNRLYINQGDLTFIDLAEQYGVAFEGFGTHAAFFDYDRDGDLDLYLLNHGVKSPEVFTKSGNRSIPDSGGDKLLQNQAAQGERGFIDVTEEAGIYSSILGFGLGVSIEDFNEDGWLDIYVSNDFTENDYLYLNNQDGTFTESLENLISNTSRYSMGNDAADLNGDGFPEIFTTDMLPEDPEIWMKSVGEDKAEVYTIKKQFGYNDQYVRNHLQLNLGKGEFSEIGLYSGIFASDWSWSPLIFDMDNDGKKDIHVTNGIVKRPNDLDFIQYSQDAHGSMSFEELRERQIEMLPSVQLPNYVFQNIDSLRFKENGKAWGLNQISYSNGSAYADLDNDGDLDLIINNLNQPAFLYQNHSEKSGNSFIKIQLKSAGQNPFGLGAEVKIFDGKKTFRQLLSTSRGFQSGTSTELVFGLGKTEAKVNAQVRWPDGKLEDFKYLEINQTYTLIKGAGSSLDLLPKPILAKAKSPIAWKHQENLDLDETKKEYLIPRSFGMEGPAVAADDINGDGLTDVYLGGAKDQAGAFFLQSLDGTFEEISNPIFQQLAKAEDVVAVFEDWNGDGNLDLYVGSGGNENETGNLFLFDRVLFGDGQGHFKFSPNSLPPIGQNTSAVAVQDINQDGFPDIFLGSSAVSGDYGASPNSHILINNGKGQFKDESEKWLGKNQYLGMVKDAKWADLDGDGKDEMIVVSHWKNIQIFSLEEDSLKEISPKGLEFSSGWINSMAIADINGDGLLDIITGNLGLNSKLKASEEKPVVLYHYDFDSNGQADPLIFHYMGDQLVPFATRDDIIKQIPGVKKQHNSYIDYSKISGPESLFGNDILSQVKAEKAYEFRSGVYFQQPDGSFQFSAFPWKAQLSPIEAIYWDENSKELWLGGNFSGFRVDLGKSMANSLTRLKWANGSWTEIPTGLKTPHQIEIRSIVEIKNGNSHYLLGATNNDSTFQLNQPEN